MSDTTQSDKDLERTRLQHERALKSLLWCACLAAECAGHLELKHRLMTFLLETKELTGTTGEPA